MKLNLTAESQTYSYEEATITFHWQRDKQDFHYRYIVYDNKMREIAKGKTTYASEEKAQDLIRTHLQF